MLLLKLKQGKTELKFRKKTRRINRDLLKGLSLATLFHLLFFAIFRIVPFEGAQEIENLPYMDVTVELGGSPETTILFNPCSLFQERLSPTEPYPPTSFMPPKEERFLIVNEEPDFSSLEGCFYEINCEEV